MIKDFILNAAIPDADNIKKVGMEHSTRAIKREYLKIIKLRSLLAQNEKPQAIKLIKQSLLRSI